MASGGARWEVKPREHGMVEIAVLNWVTREGGTGAKVGGLQASRGSPFESAEVQPPHSWSAVSDRRVESVRQTSSGRGGIASH